MGALIFTFILIVFALVFCMKSIKIVQQAEVMIIERLGKFDRILESGFQFIIPLIDNPRSIAWKQNQTLVMLLCMYRRAKRRD